MPQLNSADKFISELMSKYRKEIGLLLVGVILTGGLVLSFLLMKKPAKPEITVSDAASEVLSAEISPTELTPTPLPKIAIHISGAVNSPGVYELEEGSRVQAAIDAAGGLSASADMDFINRELNLAQKLVDGDKIYVPTKEEASTPATGSQSAAGSSSTSNVPLSSSSAVKSSAAPVAQKVNINTASASELDSLSGIGPTYAQRIIEARPFATIEDIMRVKGIGEKTFEKLKDNICVN